jgi:hypothetical protein
MIQSVTPFATGITSVEVDPATPADTGLDAARSTRRQSRLGRLLLPAGLTAVIIATGMAYTLWWPAVVRHQAWYWATPGDFWNTFRNAHFVGWGYLSDVYRNGAPLVTLPAYAVLLAPIAALSSALGLWESSPLLLMPKPTAWLLAGPFSLLTPAVALAAFDTLARRLGILGRRRLILLTAEAVALWPTVAMWGHPEDVLAIAAVAFALTAATDRAWARAGWMLGAAIAMQLLAALVVPVLAGMAGARRRVPLLIRASVLPLFFLAAVMIPDFPDTWRTLTRQPTWPLLNHPTPWVLLSPHLANHAVAAGPARIGALAVALGCGVAANFWRHDLLRLIWLAAVAMSARCIFEAVMAPYYVMPIVALALIAGARQAPWRWILTVATGLGLTISTHFHANMWVYWLEMTAPILAMLALAFPLHQQNPDRVDVIVA